MPQQIAPLRLSALFNAFYNSALYFAVLFRDWKNQSQEIDIMTTGFPSRVNRNAHQITFSSVEKNQKYPEITGKINISPIKDLIYPDS